MEKIKTVLTDIVTGGIEFDSNVEKVRAFIIINSLGITAIVILSSFSVMRFTQGALVISLVDMITSVIIIIILILLRKTKNHQLSGNLMMLLIGVFFSFLYLHGSVESTGAIWTCGFPFLACMICGYKLGAVISILFIILNGTLTLLSPTITLYQAHYTNEFLITYFSCYPVLILLAYVSEKIQSKTQNKLIEINQEKVILNKKTTQNFQEIMQVKQELEKSNSELRRFVQIGSHHLQEPLRNVVSYLQLLEQRYRGKLDGDADELIDYAVEGSIWMKHLINDLVSYTNLTKKSFKLSPVDCDNVIRQAVINLQSKIDQLNAEIIIKTGFPTVMANEKELIRLFQDLIGNSLKFCEKKPEIQLSVDKKDVSEIEIYKKDSGKSSSEMWIFSVSDNGISIPYEYQKKIFDIFEKLHPRSEYYGTGTGLALCKKIVERHGGKIWVESEVGRGSTFYFTASV